jgi:hypothetical protein
VDDRARLALVELVRSVVSHDLDELHARIEALEGQRRKPSAPVGSLGPSLCHAACHDPAICGESVLSGALARKPRYGGVSHGRS